ENTLLDFKKIIDNKDLVSSVVYEIINKLPKEEIESFLVAEIDPKYINGIDVCEKYNVNPKCGGNCLIVDGIRGDNKTRVALLVPVGYRYDMNGVVRKQINARMVSVAPLEEVLKETKMEYGSIGPIGLPSNYLIYVDSLLLNKDRIIVGSGIKKAKLSIPTSIFKSLPNVIVLDGVAKLR
ncbi:MAG: YbaK/EbsC family protein, partial [Bacilli bacterium]